LKQMKKTTTLWLSGLLCLLPFCSQSAEAEKPQLTLGFVKLTDMAPLAVALEQGFFDDEGLSVQLEAQPNWKVLQDRVLDGQLDGAHMLAGQVLASQAGLTGSEKLQTALVLDLHGNACTLSRQIWQQLSAKNQPAIPLNAATLQGISQQLKFGMVFPVSSHNYELRYWLAAGGLHPGFYAPKSGDNSGQLDADVLISVVPPPQMPAALEAGTVAGFCVGEPWNQQAAARKLGVPVISNSDIRGFMAEKVLGVNARWAAKHPLTQQKLLKALIRAGHWLDAKDNANRAAAAELIAAPHYVGADAAIIKRSMTGQFEYAPGDVRKAADFNVFFRHHATYPFYSDAIWYLTQMRRWGQLSDAKPDSWYLATAKAAFNADAYQQAAKALIAEGKFKASDFPDFARESGIKAPGQYKFADGKTFDAKAPNQYLQQFDIGYKD
jgi:nitrate/nitrite transport system substrate-binding protein